MKTKYRKETKGSKYSKAPSEKHKEYAKLYIEN